MNKLIMLALIVVTYASASHANQYSPSLPYKELGACPFEGCSYGKWIAKQSTVIHKSMKMNSPPAFTVNKNEKVTALTGVIVTSQVGRAKVINPITLGNQKADKGDIVSVLRYVGEGNYKVWYRGGITEAAVDIDIELLSKPVTKWWVKLMTKNGLVGWTSQADNFDGKDTLR